MFSDTHAFVVFEHYVVTSILCSAACTHVTVHYTVKEVIFFAAASELRVPIIVCTPSLLHAQRRRCHQPSSYGLMLHVGISQPEHIHRKLPIDKYIVQRT
jgi:hypothetical protein